MAGYRGITSRSSSRTAEAAIRAALKGHREKEDVGDGLSEDRGREGLLGEDHDSVPRRIWSWVAGNADAG